MIEVKPLDACFRVQGTLEFYLVRVSPAPYSGSPYAVATINQNGEYKFETGWFRTQKSAWREHRDYSGERAYFLHDVPKDIKPILVY